MMVSRKPILVLDDDHSVLKAVERLLKVRGFDVETFATIRHLHRAWKSTHGELPRAGYQPEWIFGHRA